MQTNETVINYPGATSSSGYRLRIYDSEVEFREREFFAHRHSDFELSFILSGSGVYRFADRSEPIASGDVFLFGSNKIHCIVSTDGDEPMRLCNVQFEPRFIWSPLANMLSREHVGLFSGRCEKLSRDTDLYPKILGDLKLIRREALDKRMGYAIVIRSRLCEIIAELMRATGTESEEDSPRRRETLASMDKAMDYISERLDAPLTLGDIASRAGFGRTYFSTLFSELNGLTPWEYITIRRIERAKCLLGETDLSVLEISGASGFTNLSNFNRTFLRFEGVTPREYRKQNRNMISVSRNIL